jgi:hypothetical protein
VCPIVAATPESLRAGICREPRTRQQSRARIVPEQPQTEQGRYARAVAISRGLSSSNAPFSSNVRCWAVAARATVGGTRLHLRRGASLARRDEPTRLTSSDPARTRWRRSRASSANRCVTSSIYSSGWASAVDLICGRADAAAIARRGTTTRIAESALPAARSLVLSAGQKARIVDIFFPRQGAPHDSRPPRPRRRRRGRCRGPSGRRPRSRSLRSARSPTSRSTERADSTISNAASLCAGALSRMTTSLRRSFGARRRRARVTNRSEFAEPNIVLIVIHPQRRKAPIMVRLVPQFIGRGSSRTSPHRIHACERPIERFAAASSRKTRRPGSTPRSRRRNLARFCWTSGRACSVGRTSFFEDVAPTAKRAMHARPMYTTASRNTAIVLRRQLEARPRSAITASSTMRSIGDRLPPPRGNGDMRLSCERAEPSAAAPGSPR